MEIRAHYVVIGIFTVGIFLLALGFVLWLSKSSNESSVVQYDVVFTEAVTGLSRGSLVQYNGIKVGEVTQLKLAPDDARKVLARISVDGGTPIKQDTRAKLGLQGVTGVAFIQLSGGSPGSPPLLPTEKNPVPIIPSEESALSKLLASGSDIAVSVNDMLMRMSEVLSQENVDHVGATLKHLDEITGTVADQRADLANALKQLADATGQIKTTLTTLDTMANTTNDLIRNDAHDVLQATKKAIDNVDKVAESINGLLVTNRSAIDSFSNQGLRQVGPTLAELRETLRALKQLSGQLGESRSVLLGRDQPKEFQGK